MHTVEKGAPQNIFVVLKSVYLNITLLTGFESKKLSFLLKLSSQGVSKTISQGISIIFSLLFDSTDADMSSGIGIEKYCRWEDGRMLICVAYVWLIVVGAWCFMKLLVLWHLTSPSASLLTSECFLSSLSFKVYRSIKTDRVLMFFVMSYIVRSYIDRVLKLEHVQSI